MDKSHLLCTLIVVRLLDVINALLKSQENDEDLLGSEVPYLSIIKALMYFANYIWRDIGFVVNMLSKI